MSDQEKKLEAVEACVITFADIENGLEALKPLFDRLHREIGVAYDAGVGKHAEALRIRNGIEAARGMVSNSLEKVIAVHGKCTAIAIREGCDVVLPPSLAIDGGLVQPLGGGR